MMSAGIMTPRSLPQCRHCVHYGCVLLIVFIIALSQADSNENQTPLDYFVDFDIQPVSNTDTNEAVPQERSHMNSKTINNGLSNSLKSGEVFAQQSVGEFSIINKANDIVVDVDDEDLLVSGSGSGSGAFSLDIVEERHNGVLTPTTSRPKTQTEMQVTIRETNKKLTEEMKPVKNIKRLRLYRKNKNKKKDKKEDNETWIKTPAINQEENGRKENALVYKKGVQLDRDEDNASQGGEIQIENRQGQDKSQQKNEKLNANLANELKEDVVYLKSKRNGQNIVKSIDHEKEYDRVIGYLNGEEVFEDGTEKVDKRDNEIDNDYNDGDGDYEDEDDDDDEAEDMDEYYYEEMEEGKEDPDSQYDISDVQVDDGKGDKLWSKWRKVGHNTKIRVKECPRNGLDGKRKSCSEVKVQVKTCTDVAKGECGISRDMSPDTSRNCEAVCLSRHNTSSSATPTTPSLGPVPSPTPLPTSPSDPEECQYSLYDKKRKKYVYVRWDISRLMSERKLKLWCREDNTQYIFMSTPTDLCRKLYSDLCAASQKCKSKKVPRERGDFAEGCWRELVFGNQLPKGLSNQQTTIYFICQRYSSVSAIGRSFGYKETHFGTLYDTKLRGPILSLHKMVQVGDETWPESQYLIEHGLIEEKKDVMWLYSRHQKGMVALPDLDRCYDDQPCDFGRFQVLPGDYSSTSGNTKYTPTPFIWPEWMSHSPAARIATLTMTNSMPLLSTLTAEWQAAIKKVRTFAVSKCGVPYISDPNTRQHDQFLSSHRTNKSALYLASGAIPSVNPVQQTGRGVHVPSHFWVAGCCVKKTMRASDKHENEAFVVEDEVRGDSAETSVSSFSFFIKNVAGSHVAYTSVFQLELLLGDFYKVTDNDPEVSLFPGQESACSDLKDNVSGWFQRQ